jgi:hypothetical protein
LAGVVITIVARVRRSKARGLPSRPDSVTNECEPSRPRPDHRSSPSPLGTARPGKRFAFGTAATRRRRARSHRQGAAGLSP